MCQGGQGNFNMQRPGFAPGSANDPAQGGSGYWGGGSASWGGDYGNWANKNVPQPIGQITGGGYNPSPYPNWSPPGLMPQGNWGNPWGQWIQSSTGPGFQATDPNAATQTTTQTTDPFAGIDAGRLAQAQRFANAGMMGRAQQQIGLGGGNWGDVGGLLRQQAKATDNYGGDWNWGGISDANLAQAKRFASAGMMGRAEDLFGDDWNKQMHTQLQAESKANPYTKGTSMGFDWGDATAGRLAKAKELAAAGKMGQAQKMYERGGGKWSPGIHSQFKAWQKANT